MLFFQMMIDLTYTIDGVKFELLTDSDSHLIVVVTPNINYFKDIYIEYVDGDFEFLPLRINNIEIIKSMTSRILK